MNEKTQEQAKIILALICFGILTWALVVVVMWWAELIGALVSTGAILFFAYIMVKMVKDYTYYLLRTIDFVFKREESDFKELKKELERKKK